jgi:hypothetical protein
MRIPIVRLDGPAFMAGKVITLGQVSTRLSVLEVACLRCDRRGRLNTIQLLSELNPDLRISELREIVAGDCPRMVADKINDRCGVYFPGLLRAFDL